MFSYILYQELYQSTFFKHQNQLHPMCFEHTGGADSGHSWLVRPELSGFDMESTDVSLLFYEQDVRFHLSKPILDFQ